MINKVLVPVDINIPTTSPTLNCARDIVSKLRADFSIANISAGADAKQKSPSLNIETTTQVYEESGKVKVIPIRDILKGLAAYIEVENINLIALIDKALPGIKLNKLSDISMKLLRQTKIPVMLIRSNQLNGQHSDVIKKIIVPLDGTEDTGPIVQHVAEIASAFKTEVILLHVIPPEDGEPVVASSTFLNHQNKVMEEKRVLSSYYLSKITEQFKLIYAEINVVCETRTGLAADQIVGCAYDHDVDLMAMSTRGHTGLRRWVFGSTATEVIRRYDKSLFLIGQ